MKFKKKTITLSIFCVALLLWTFGMPAAEPLPPLLIEEEAVPVPEEPKTVKIELAAVGDNIMHMPVIKSCAAEYGYNFHGLYENIKKYLDGADIKAVNQETVFINNPSRYSGFPSFGSPSAVGAALAGAGFNVIEQASNHSFDKGVEGLSDTITFWKTQPVTLLGVSETPEEAQRIDKFTKDGFTVAMLNYTYGLNGYVLPLGREYLVDVLSGEARPAIAQRLTRAKEESDLVVVFVHWGTEYTFSPTDYQRDWLKFFNENGVDLVIGSHPHVIQPAEEYTGESGHKTVVFYSLGNFISNQDSIAKELGGMARVTLVKDEKGARIENFSLEPLFTHVSGGKYTVYMLSDYTDDLAATHSKYGGGLTTGKIWEKYYEITGFPQGQTRP